MDSSPFFDNGTLILIWLAGLVIFGAILYYFLRFTFDVEKRTADIEKQTRLLMKMAEKQGISRQEVYESVGY